MKTIMDSQKIPILVDDDDFDLLSNYRWRVSDRYADATINGKTVKMHRLILGVCDTNIHIDHINGVTTDNRKENLRICTRYQNQQNRKTNINNSLGVKCVRKIKSGYRVRVQAFGERRHLGVFKTLEEAISAREAYAKEKHGEFYRNTRPIEDALRAENADLTRRNIDLESEIERLRAELNQKNLDVFGGE